MWRFKGKMKVGKKRKKWVTFTKEIDAPTKERAVELLYSLLGSNHHVKRSQIVIEEVEEI